MAISYISANFNLPKKKPWMATIRYSDIAAMLENMLRKRVRSVGSKSSWDTWALLIQYAISPINLIKNMLNIVILVVAYIFIADLRYIIRESETKVSRLIDYMTATSNWRSNMLSLKHIMNLLFIFSSIFS